MIKPTLEQQIQWNKDFLEDLEKENNFDSVVTQWDYLSVHEGVWRSVNVGSNINFFDGYHYRRKGSTRIINGFEVPAPVSIDYDGELFGMGVLNPMMHPAVKRADADLPMPYLRALHANGFIYYSESDALKNLCALRGEDPAKVAQND